VTDRYPGRHRDPPRTERMLAIASAVLVIAVVGATITWATTRNRGAAAPPAAKTSTPASSPTPTAAASPSSGPLRDVTIAAVGDTMLGRTPVLPPDPSTYLDPVHSALRAPIVFGNLEGTLTDATDSKCPKPSPSPSPSRSPKRSPTPSPTPSPQCFAFRAPPSYALALRRAGFTVLNNANNHSYDFGSAGLQQTLHALDAATSRTRACPARSPSCDGAGFAWPSWASPPTAPRPRCSTCRRRAR
jgi:hypothetical protein